MKFNDIMETVFPGIAAKRERAKFEATRFKAMSKLTESIPAFAEDTDEGDWSLATPDHTPYTEHDLTTMRESSRTLYYQDPGARGVIDTLDSYVLGKDASITCVDEDESVQDYWDGWAEYNDWDERMSEFLWRAFVDGEVFMRFFLPGNGMDYQPVRFIEPSEIMDKDGKHTFGIECLPDDIEVPLKYYRSFTVNGVEKTETIPAEEIIHFKIMVPRNVKRGISFLTGIGKYLTQYRLWLKDRVYLNKIRHAFHLVATPRSSSANTTGSLFEDTTKAVATGRDSAKKMPEPGSVLIAKGFDYEFKNLNINASDTAGDGRAIELMVAKGTNFAEYIVRGDASNANYSSTMVSESPMVKAFEKWQDRIEKPFKKVVKKVINFGIGRGQIPAKSTITTKSVNDKGEELENKEIIETRTDCVVNFATLIHRDIKEETDSLTIQKNNKWASDRTCSTKLGYKYNEEKEQIEREEQEREEKARSTAGMEYPPSPGAGEQPSEE